MKTYFPPEGTEELLQKSKAYFASLYTLEEARNRHILLEGRVVRCDRAHNLHVQLGAMEGIISRENCAIGIQEGTLRDIAILSRVGKSVCFYIESIDFDESGKPVARLNRRAVQEDCREQYLHTLSPGDLLDAVVTRMEPFGAFCDVGAGVPALLPIDSICVSRIPHPRARFYVGQPIRAIFRALAPDGKITLTHKELLGTWSENAAHFSVGETVPGIVRSVESYGIFIELTPNLAGLAEYSPHVHAGESASVYIKAICPEKMKFKLILIDHGPAAPTNFSYSYPQISHVSTWPYSPPFCEKQVKTVF